MKHLKDINFFNKGKKYFNIYYKLIEDLDIGDYVTIKLSNKGVYSNYENEVGEVVDMSESQVYIFFKKFNNTIWIKKEYIIKHSKLKKDIEEFIEAYKDSKKYNL